MLGFIMTKLILGDVRNAALREYKKEERKQILHEKLGYDSIDDYMKASFEEFKKEHRK